MPRARHQPPAGRRDVDGQVDEQRRGPADHVGARRRGRAAPAGAAAPAARRGPVAPPRRGPSPGQRADAGRATPERRHAAARTAPCPSTRSPRAGVRLVEHGGLPGATPALRRRPARCAGRRRTGRHLARDRRAVRAQLHLARNGSAGAGPVQVGAPVRTDVDAGEVRRPDRHRAADRLDAQHVPRPRVADGDARGPRRWPTVKP